MNGGIVTLQKFEWASLDKSPWRQSCYTVGLSLHAIQVAARLLPKGFDKFFTYHWLVISLFGLQPNDFFHYIQANYDAVIELTSHSFVKTVYFPSVVKAYDFAKEVEKRFQYCIDNKYFGEYYDDSNHG